MRRTTAALLALAVLLALLVFRNNALTAAPGEDPVLVGAGDIANGGPGAEATAQLLDVIPGTVATFGDNAYADGTDLEFATYYDPTWGRHKGRTKPSAGNHDYNTAGAAGYYNYFGAAAGDPAKGYYSYDLGSWHIVVLNSNCSFVTCAAGSPQEQWLRADLAANPATCIAAYWHHPLYSSGTTHGSTPDTRDLYQALYDFGAELVMNGHEHNYERFAPQNAAGQLDLSGGIREFVVGTGGAGHYGLGTPIANSEVRDSDTFGVLRLTLHPSSYDWQFVPEAGKTFTDSGSASCTGAPTGTGTATPTPTPTPTPTAVPGNVGYTSIGSSSAFTGSATVGVQVNVPANFTARKMWFYGRKGTAGTTSCGLAVYANGGAGHVAGNVIGSGVANAVTNTNGWWEVDPADFAIPAGLHWVTLACQASTSYSYQLGVGNRFYSCSLGFTGFPRSPWDDTGCSYDTGWVSIYIERAVPDSDGDGVPDSSDNCPAWPNPSQALPPWPVPANDRDCDGFTDGQEGTIGTDAADPCSDNSSDDAWPPDFDRNKVINISDLSYLLPPTFSIAVPPASARRDLAPDGVINISDVMKVLPPYFGTVCT